MSTIGVGAFLAYFLVLILIGIGWVMNVISIVNTISDPISGMFVLRCVGIPIVPLGGVLGWF
jgi:hypothetical protein